MPGVDGAGEMQGFLNPSRSPPLRRFFASRADQPYEPIFEAVSDKAEMSQATRKGAIPVEHFGGTVFDLRSQAGRTVEYRKPACQR